MPQRGFSDERLVRFALDELTGEDRAEVRAHVDASKTARAFVGRVRAVIEIMRGDDVEAPSAAAVARAIAAWPAGAARPAGAAASSLLATIDRVVATLVFDSRALPALAGFRGGGGEYQLAFDSAAARIEVGVTPFGSGAAAAWRVRGLVTPCGPGAVGAVRLVTAGSSETRVETAADDEGHFRLDAGPGSYDLVVETESGTVVAPDLALG